MLSSLILWLFITQMAPAFTSFFYDLAVLFFTFLNLKIIKNIYLLLFGVLITALLIWGLIIYNTKWQYPSWSAADIRPFIVIPLVNLLLLKSKDPIRLFIGCVNIYIFSSLVFIILAYADLNSYFWTSESYPVGSHSINFGRPMSVNEVASLQGRYSGFFIQPVCSGIVNVILLFFVVLLTFDKIIPKMWGVFAIFSILIIGRQSLSTVFTLFPLIFIILYLLQHKKIAITLIFIFFSTILITFATFSQTRTVEIIQVVEAFLTSGRYGENSHIIRMLTFLNPSAIDVMFGFNPKIMGWEGKGIGDSGYLLKLLTGGVFYIFFYFLLMYKLYVHDKSKSPYLHNVTLSVFIFLMLVETGTTAFSLPQVTVFVAIFSLLYQAIVVRANSSMKCNTR